MLSDGTYDYEYDAEGNRVLRTNISTGDYTVYIWDHRNRLVSVIEMDCDGTPANFGDDVATQEVDYAYDANNQLVRRVADTDGATGSDPVEQTVWLWHDGQMILRFDQTGSGNLDYGDLSHRYLWGPAVDMLLADEQVDWGDTFADGEVLWALTDHQGTARDVVDNNGTVRLHREIDSFGNVLNAFHYDAAGDPVAENDPEAVTVDFIYTGKLFDVYVGMQYHWNRWYDPAIGRWISEDPIGFTAGDPNLGRYVGNSPTMFTDPSGLELEYTQWHSGRSIQLMGGPAKRPEYRPPVIVKVKPKLEPPPKEKDLTPEPEQTWGEWASGWGNWFADLIPYVGSGKKAIEGGMAIADEQAEKRARRKALYDKIASDIDFEDPYARSASLYMLGESAKAIEGAIEFYSDFVETAGGSVQASTGGVGAVGGIGKDAGKGAGKTAAERSAGKKVGLQEPSRYKDKIDDLVAGSKPSQKHLGDLPEKPVQPPAATKSTSPIWKNAKPYRGKTKTNGISGSGRRYYEWDHTHGDIEVYDPNGDHLGSIDPRTGTPIKPPVPGRKIDL